MKRTVLFAAVAALAWALIGCAPKSLLLVTQYPDGSPRAAEAEAAIRARVRLEDRPFRLRVYNMNMVGQVGDVWRDEAAKMAVVRLHSAEPDVIFVAGDDAACYFAKRVVGLPSRFVFFDVKGEPAAYRLESSPETAITGVVEDVPVREVFSLIRQVVPTARGVAVLADESLEGDAVVAKIGAAHDLPVRVLLVKRARTLHEWMAALQEVQDKADALVIASCSEVLRDAAGNTTVPSAELLQTTAKFNRLPDFSFWKEAVGPDGLLGAVTVPISAQARMAADMAVQAMFYGADLREIPAVQCNARATYTSAERAAQLGVKLPGAAPSKNP